MGLELLVFALVILVPFPIGFALGHFRPHTNNLKNAGIAAVPACLPFFGFAIWIAVTQYLECTDDACEQTLPLLAMAMFVLGVVTAVTGYGIGLLGDAFARNRAEKKQQ